MSVIEANFSTAMKNGLLDLWRSGTFRVAAFGVSEPFLLGHSSFSFLYPSGGVIQMEGPSKNIEIAANSFLESIKVQKHTGGANWVTHISWEPSTTITWPNGGNLLVNEIKVFIEDVE